MTEYMQGYLDEANVTDIDPAPHLRLIDGKMRHKILSENHSRLKQSQKQMIYMEAKVRQMKPRAELTMLETRKYLRSGGNLRQQASDQFTQSGIFNQKVDFLERDITNLVNELRNYEISGTSRIDIQRALNECG